MDLLSDVKTPLTASKVRSLARATFAEPFEKLCNGAPDFKWLEFDVNDPTSIGTDRAVYRHLKRSKHNRLLVVGWYSPGHADVKPTDRVAAHVHADPAEVRFYRIVQGKDGSRSLEDVNSTSAVDFDPPFCDVGDGQGDHRAGHRVTALIEWFFLDAGLVAELARPEGDPSKFPRNFRHACMWVGNEGSHPGELLTRRSSGATLLEEKDSIPVRPKRSSTVSYRQSTSEEIRSPPIKRSATDTVQQIKRQREDETHARPTKHRRTLSEQITPLNLSRSHLKQSSNPPSPRTPTLGDAERINRALGLRIIHLHDQYRALKSSFADTETIQVELQKELEDAKNTVSRVEASWPKKSRQS
ncbi:hypothetical protein BU23DRAFT_571408 [Bimuria novae-zelandiae CBS 107.79]|uniref:Uncharacterized protein n=1 Tax=Bimuria novae-zelandiae CBS 107.79 TaxID=1447943 RepID=A0A6A5UYH1_9PLEO|nr:hypothetical protein BU23DRAFT_571408 [Bimuria novae-zelandiae CBS 107.79]